MSFLISVPCVCIKRDLEVTKSLLIDKERNVPTCYRYALCQAAQVFGGGALKRRTNKYDSGADAEQNEGVLPRGEL